MEKHDVILKKTHIISKYSLTQSLGYRVSQKTWEFSDELDIVFVMN